jgi:hypothetical protein
VTGTGVPDLYPEAVYVPSVFILSYIFTLLSLFGTYKGNGLTMWFGIVYLLATSAPTRRGFCFNWLSMLDMILMRSGMFSRGRCGGRSILRRPVWSITTEDTEVDSGRINHSIEPLRAFKRDQGIKIKDLRRVKIKKKRGLV